MCETDKYKVDKLYHGGQKTRSCKAGEYAPHEIVELLLTLSYHLVAK